MNPDSLLQQFQFAEGEEIQALFRIAPNLKVVNKLHINLKVKFSGFVYNNVVISYFGMAFNKFYVCKGMVL